MEEMVEAFSKFSFAQIFFTLTQVKLFEIQLYLLWKHLIDCGQEQFVQTGLWLALAVLIQQQEQVPSS